MYIVASNARKVMCPDSPGREQPKLHLLSFLRLCPVFLFPWLILIFSL
jgi:hypothetical protein